VDIDIDHNIQTEVRYTGVYANDSGAATDCAIKWNSPFTALELGRPVDPLLAGKRWSKS
jgi:hypothetical protein